jgi:hypothetical protein
MKTGVISRFSTPSRTARGSALGDIAFFQDRFGELIGKHRGGIQQRFAPAAASARSPGIGASTDGLAVGPSK